MTVYCDTEYQPGQAAWFYWTFTNADMIDPVTNPNGLVDADPVAVTTMDISGNQSTGVATHLSLGFYRYMLQFTQGGGSYVIAVQGSGYGTASEEVVVRVGRSIIGG